jgi:adenylate kinase family enzyme
MSARLVSLPRGGGGAAAVRRVSAQATQRSPRIRLCAAVSPSPRSWFAAQAVAQPGTPAGVPPPPPPPPPSASAPAASEISDPFPTETVVRKLFDIFDDHASGRIELDAFQRLMRLAGTALSPQDSAAAFSWLFEQRAWADDLPAGKYCTFDVFYRWISSGCPLPGVDPVSLRVVQLVTDRVFTNYGLKHVEHTHATSLIPVDKTFDTTPSVNDANEIKDPRLIFERVWRVLERTYGREQLRFPKEVIWLMGAPGSGKSTNSAFLRKARGFTGGQIIVSQLLKGPEVEGYIARGEMLPDFLVVRLLLEKLLEPRFSEGVLVDGFPRTKVQVECVYKLKERMNELREEFKNTEHKMAFRRPRFRVAVLFVPERISVERQMERGRKARERNKQSQTDEDPTTKLQAERDTDFSEEVARQRYQVFRGMSW